MRNRVNEISLIWGDLHLGDKGMFNRTYSKTFKTPHDYFTTLVANHNKVANEDTVTLFLGDLGQEQYFKTIENMRGYKILIKGNHDVYNDKVYYQYFDEVYNYNILGIATRIIASHIPVPVEPGVINVHGHTHEIKLDNKHYINVCPEHTGYKPVYIKHLRNKLQFLEKPSYKFLYEWYKDIQLSEPRDDLVIENNLIKVKESLELRELNNVKKKREKIIE